MRPQTCAPDMWTPSSMCALTPKCHKAEGLCATIATCHLHLLTRTAFNRHIYHSTAQLQVQACDRQVQVSCQTMAKPQDGPTCWIWLVSPLVAAYRYSCVLLSSCFAACCLTSVLTRSRSPSTCTTQHVQHAQHAYCAQHAQHAQHASFMSLSQLSDLIKPLIHSISTEPEYVSTPDDQYAHSSVGV